MNPETAEKQVTEDDNQRWNDWRDLLREVHQATVGSSDSALHQFTAALLQLVELHSQAGDEDFDAEDFDAEQVAALVESGVAEIRSLVDADVSTSQQMAELHEHAVQRWGHLLTPVDCDSAVEEFAEHWDGDQPSALEDEDEEPILAPSASVIHSLLSSIGHHDEASQLETKPEVAQETEQSNNADSVAATESIDTLDPELREAFLDDAQCCVSSIEEALLRLESNPADNESVNQICRELHTLKGASASVGLAALADQLHQLEDDFRDDQSAGRSPAIDKLLASIDAIRNQIGTSQREEDSVAGDATEPGQQSVQPAERTDFAFDEAATDEESVRVKSSQLNRLMDMLAELVMLRNRRETELSELQEIYHELIGSASKMRLLSNETDTQDSDCGSLQLSEIANDVLEIAQSVRDCATPVAEGNAAVSTFIRQFRQELVELRRTPVSGLFRRLQRVVRDASHAEDKQVRLELLGDDAGIERSLQQRLYEPLLHIVRNSVCHGIESPEERQASGKAAVGTITLEAKSGPDLFVIEVRDDGRGLNYDAIRRRGIESGLLATNQAASRQELAQLIFQPGFSTRQSTDQLAGRGVGMDVVASTLDRLRGWVEVHSEPQHGTRIRLSFPIPSVIQHAMVFQSGGQLFALPMQSVQQAGEGHEESLCLLFSELWDGKSSNVGASTQKIALAFDHTTSESSTALPRVTLLVDEIVGPEEVVVRPLPPLLRQHPFCCGATLSAMGQTVLLLDARRIIDSQRHHLHRNEPGQNSDQVQDYSRPTRPRILVVDDSVSARKRVVRSLARYDVEIVEAGDGKQALAMLKTQTFDVVLSDMEMPHISGMELLAEINCRDSANVPPVVIISSRSEDEFTRPALELGACDYLIKPLSDEALDSALSNIDSLKDLTSRRPDAQSAGLHLPTKHQEPGVQR